MSYTFPNRPIVPTKPAVFGPCSPKAERWLLRLSDAAVWLGTAGIIIAIFVLTVRNQPHHNGPLTTFGVHRSR